MSDFDWFHTSEEFISINYITIVDEFRIHWVDGPTVNNYNDSEMWSR